MIKKYVTTGVSFPDPELLEMVKKAARDEGRSLSNFVCRVLEEHFAEDLNDALPRQTRVLAPAEPPRVNSPKVDAARDLAAAGIQDTAVRRLLKKEAKP
jgi:hypothetical protein